MLLLTLVIKSLILHHILLESWLHKLVTTHRILERSLKGIHLLCSWLSRLGFNVIISRFNVNSLFINDMSLLIVLVDGHESQFVLLGFILVLESHFNKTKASSFVCMPISHHNCIYYCSMILKILDQIRFYINF